MLGDYRQYLINLRNNLIQCGVEFPINPMNTYKEIFYEADKIKQVLWYYSMMNISGSDSALKGYFIPLSGHYKSKMRDVFYKEFEDFLKDYKKISYLAYQLGEGYTVESKPEFKEDIIQGDEEIDLVDDTEEYLQLEPEVKQESKPHDFIAPVTSGDVVFEDDLVQALNNLVNTVHGTFIDDISTKSDIVVQTKEVHGVFIDDTVELVAQESAKVTTGYVTNEVEVHGIFIDDLSVFEDKGEPEGVQTKEIHGIFIDDVVEETQTKEVHGVFLDDDPEILPEIETILTDDLEIHGIFLDDVEVFAKNDSSISENGVYYTGGIEEENKIHGIFLDDLPDILEDGGDLDDPEEVSFEEEDDFDENVYVEEPESEYGTSESNVMLEEEKTVKHTPVEKDLADILQETTNNLLTKGKRVFVRKVREMKKG
mgnify:CR=1 FL=1